MAPPVVHQVLASSGKPLDATTREYMEPRFGHDFGRVRVHTDNQAAESAKAVRAHAYAVGEHVVFGAGRFAPHTNTGRRLLAHELAHTVQQRSGMQLQKTDVLAIGGAQDSSEREAHAAANSIANGDSFRVRETAMSNVARSDDQAEQPGWAARAKAASYRAIIATMRGTQRLVISTARRAAALLPSGVREIVEGIVDAQEVMTDLMISLVLAVISIAVGLVSGLIDLVKSAFVLSAGLLTGIWLAEAALLTGDPAPFKLWLTDVWTAIRGIPDAVRALITGWLAEFNTADIDRQTIMIGELTGQILALLAPFLLSGGAAGAAAAGSAARTGAGAARLTLIAGGRGAAEAGAVVDAASTAAKAGTVADVGASAGRAGASASTAVGESVIPITRAANRAARLSSVSQGSDVVVASRGGGSATTALKPMPAPVIEPLPVPVRPVPKLVPPLPPSAPVQAAAKGTSAVKKIATGVGVGVATAADIATKEEDGDQNSMRHQIQRSDNHYASRAVMAPVRQGVTALQLRATMAANFEQYMNIARGDQAVPRGWTRGPVDWQSPIRTAIIAQSQAITGIVAAGGIRTGGDVNALRRCFNATTLAPSPRCASDDVRLDVENRGHNLRPTTGGT